jgi:hypothetical protein
VLDTTLIPALQRVRACRHGLFAGLARFGWCVSKTDRIYGFVVAPSVSRSGVITAFGLAPADATSARWLHHLPAARSAPPPLGRSARRRLLHQPSEGAGPHPAGPPDAAERQGRCSCRARGS